MNTDSLRVSYSHPRDPWQVEVPGDDIAALLAPWNGRRRAYLVALLNGCSKRQAAARAGVTPRACQLWAKANPAFQRAVSACLDIGLGTVVEPELYARALDREHKGSLRALELVLRSRSEDYRRASASRTTWGPRGRAARRDA